MKYEPIIRRGSSYSISALSVGEREWVIWPRGILFYTLTGMWLLTVHPSPLVGSLLLHEGSITCCRCLVLCDWLHVGPFLSTMCRHSCFSYVDIRGFSLTLLVPPMALSSQNGSLTWHNDNTTLFQKTTHPIDSVRRAFEVCLCRCNQIVALAVTSMSPHNVT